MDWTRGFLQDLRYAARLARRQPRHALLTIGMTALGIGATTALFSVAYGVLWKPLPWPHAAQFVPLLLPSNVHVLGRDPGAWNEFSV